MENEEDITSSSTMKVMARSIDKSMDKANNTLDDNNMSDSELKTSRFSFIPWVIWCLGIFVSALPVIVFKLSEFIISNDGEKIISGNYLEIFYICVTMLIPAIFELFSKNWEKMKLKVIIMAIQIIVLLSALALYFFLYVVVAVRNDSLDDIINTFYISFLFVSFILGTISFINDHKIKENK